MEELKERVAKLVSRGWTETQAYNYIDNELSAKEEEDDWFMVKDRDTGEWVDIRL